MAHTLLPSETMLVYGDDGGCLSDASCISEWFRSVLNHSCRYVTLFGTVHVDDVVQGVWAVAQHMVPSCGLSLLSMEDTCCLSGPGVASNGLGFSLNGAGAILRLCSAAD
jgi:hypothetical protein